MMNAIGLSAPEATAAVRAKMMRFMESAILDRFFQPITLAEVPEDGIPALVPGLRSPGPTAREARLVRLATMPVRECVRVLPDRALPVPLILALPEPETKRPLNAAAVVQALAEQVSGSIDVQRAGAPFRGRAGGIKAIGRAADVVRAGQSDFVLAGGIDTYRDLFVLGVLDHERRLKTARNLDGFIPGEGAGFVLVARESAAEKHGLRVLATVPSWAEASEPGHLYADEPYRGEGLASAVARALAGASASLPVQRVFTSMNGENHWAKEWGVAFQRNRAGIAEDYLIAHPADCYGDAGAAAGPMLAALAALSGEPGSAALVYASSDHAERAALIVAAA